LSASLSPTGSRAYIGLGILGWGLSILLRVAPHEDPFVGAGLALFGAVLAFTSPSWPRIRRLPRVLVATIGLLAILSIVAFDAYFHAPWNVTKAAIVVYGFALVASVPLLERTVKVPRSDSQTVPVSTLVACSMPIVGVPLAMWTLQATFKSVLGSTPLEAFVRVGLLVPMKWLLLGLGWSPKLSGQTIEYATRNGPLRVEVGAACSGIQAMALFGAVLALYLWVERPMGRRLAVWTTIGVVGVYAANLLRLATLMVVGHQWGSDALLKVHEQAGWIFFVAWAVLFARLARSKARPPALPSAAAGSRIEATGSPGAEGG
jgi:exosortase/archaeosortase family protein